MMRSSAAWLSRPWFSATLGGLGACLLSLPLLRFDFWFDQGVFATIADTLRAGGMAYRDAWEHKPPGIFFVYAAAFSILGRDIWAVRVLEIVAVGIAAAGLVFIGENRFGSRRSGLCAALLLPALYLTFAPNTAQPETFQLPCLVWALAAVPLEPGEKRAGPRCFLSGLLVSAAILFKTPAAIFAVLLLVERGVRDFRRPEWIGKIALSGCTLAGLLLLPALVGGYYAIRGAFLPLWDALVVFPSEYAANSLGQSLRFHWDHFSDWLSSMLVPPEIGLLLLGFAAGGLSRTRDMARWGACLLAS